MAIGPWPLRRFPPKVEGASGRTVVLRENAGQMFTHDKPKVPVGVLAITLAAAAFVGGSCAGEAQSNVFSLREQADWVTVTDIDGLSFDMPKQPRHKTVPMAGSNLDLFTADFSDIDVAAGAARVPRDSRTDAQVLRDGATGAAANVGGTIVNSRPTVVDGVPALDFEITTPQQGGQGMFARVALADDLLVIVQTAFDQDDRDVATEPHQRIAGSIRFEP